MSLSQYDHVASWLTLLWRCFFRKCWNTSSVSEWSVSSLLLFLCCVARETQQQDLEWHQSLLISSHGTVELQAWHRAKVSKMNARPSAIRKVRMRWRGLLCRPLLDCLHQSTLGFRWSIHLAHALVWFLLVLSGIWKVQKWTPRGARLVQEPLRQSSHLQSRQDTPVLDSGYRFLSTKEQTSRTLNLQLVDYTPLPF